MTAHKKNPRLYPVPRNDKNFQNYTNLICSDCPSGSISPSIIHLHYYFLKLFKVTYTTLAANKKF